MGLKQSGKLLNIPFFSPIAKGFSTLLCYIHKYFIPLVIISVICLIMKSMEKIKTIYQKIDSASISNSDISSGEIKTPEVNSFLKEGWELKASFAIADSIIVYVLVKDSSFESEL